MASNINYVSEGDFTGKQVVSGFGKQVFINKGTFSTIDITPKTVDQVKILSKDLSEKKEKVYSISLLFKTKEKCTVVVDNEIYKKITSLFPEADSNGLEELLSDGWKIIGYSTVLLGSGMSDGMVKSSMGMNEKHCILLQKDKKVRTYCSIVNGKGEEIEHSEIIFN